MAGPAWWDEMARTASAAGHDPFSVAWYTSMRDQYVVAFPEADQRSLENMNSFINWAARRDWDGNL